MCVCEGFTLDSKNLAYNIELKEILTWWQSLSKKNYLVGTSFEKRVEIITIRNLISMENSEFTVMQTAVTLMISACYYYSNSNVNLMQWFFKKWDKKYNFKKKKQSTQVSSITLQLHRRLLCLQYTQMYTVWKELSSFAWPTNLENSLTRL